MTEETVGRPTAAGGDDRENGLEGLAEDAPLVDVAERAATAGFETLEIACWPRAGYAARRYAGTSHVDVVDLSDDRAREIVDELADRGLSISGLGYYL